MKVLPENLNDENDDVLLLQSVKTNPKKGGRRQFSNNLITLFIWKKFSSENERPPINDADDFMIGTARACQRLGWGRTKLFAEIKEQSLLDSLVTQELAAIAAAQAAPHDESLLAYARQVRARRCMIRVRQGSGLAFWRGEPK
jgi:hypothetical protein